MSDAVPRLPEPPPEPKRPFWRDPFFLAFLVGAALVTLAAPRFRKVAPPPEVSGTLPAWSLVDQDGKAVGSKELAGHVALIGLVSQHAPEATRRVAAAMVELEPRFGTARADVALLFVDLDGRSPEALKAWLAAEAPALHGARVLTGPDACATAVLGFAPAAPKGTACDAAWSVATDARLLILDAKGQPRGSYGSAGEPLYEAFERTLRTCDLARNGG